MGGAHTGQRWRIIHCNAGALATAGYGRRWGDSAAVEAGKKIHVYADETRPFLQGSRLTAWELMRMTFRQPLFRQHGGRMMKQEDWAIIVGADRIAANGTSPTRLGRTVAVLAKEHGLPFYVAAPISTVDLETADGSGIPIEQRNPAEITHIAGKAMTPPGSESRTRRLM
jgi:methylthioribose-1-phosphate isomerase